MCRTITKIHSPTPESIDVDRDYEGGGVLIIAKSWNGKIAKNWVIELYIVSFWLGKNLPEKENKQQQKSAIQDAAHKIA